MTSLTDFCDTERQVECVTAWEIHNRNAAKAAGDLGVSSSTVRAIVNGVRTRAAAAGFSENWDATRHVPAGEHVIGRSLFITDDEGNKA